MAIKYDKFSSMQGSLYGTLSPFLAHWVHQWLCVACTYLHALSIVSDHLVKVFLLMLKPWGFVKLHEVAMVFTQFELFILYSALAFQMCTLGLCANIWGWNVLETASQSINVHWLRFFFKNPVYLAYGFALQPTYFVFNCCLWLRNQTHSDQRPPCNVMQTNTVALQ